MDTITHTLFGLTIYGAIDKENISKNRKKAYFFSALVGSQIPDIDIIANVTEQGRIMEQMWHRGLTHSIFLVPIWATLIYFLCQLFWKEKDRRIWNIAFISVLIHISSDVLNTWGTGYFEPISSARLSFGTISIVDFIFWSLMLLGFVLSKVWKKVPPHRIYRLVWIGIFLHVLIQSVQGYLIYREASTNYEEVALRATFIPWHYTVIGKNGATVEIASKTVWGEWEIIETLRSAENADLEPLFNLNPKAKVLLQWSPFVVIVDDETRIGIYDPRFYKNGESFLFEYVEKKQLE